MPSRLGILGILSFWLASTTWLTVREIVPVFRAGEPPAFFTDVTDEVGGTTINWTILHKGQRVGDATSQVRRRPDRTFELASTLRFENFQVKTCAIKKIAGSYRVDKNGNLKELAAEVRIASPIELNAQVKGTVRDGVFYPRIFKDGVETNLGPLQPQPMPVASHGNVLNTMLLVNKIAGLRTARSWKVPQFDPLGAILPGVMTSSVLIAEVKEDNLVWQGKTVGCFRIDYQEPGKRPTAHTWVRRDDGLVLQQEAKLDDRHLVLVREVSK